MTREEAIIAILGRFRTQRVYRASRDAGTGRYAVFADNVGQVSEPASHIETETTRRRLIAAAIVALYEGAE